MLLAIVGLVAATLVFSPVPALAQATSGGMIGTVTDSSGAVVPNAKVTILNLDQNRTTETATNESGNYTQTQLASGHYRITVEESGFQPFVINTYQHAPEENPQQSTPRRAGL